MPLGVKCLVHSVNSGNAVPFIGQMFSEYFLCVHHIQGPGEVIRIRQKEFFLSKSLHPSHSHLSG